MKYQGLCIEFKTPKGTGSLSPQQKQWLTNVRLNGHLVLISDDYHKIVETIRKYFEDVRLICPHCMSKPQYFKSKETLDKHLKSFHWNGKTIHEI